ncbi:MAG: hypothetical protein AAGA48_02370 [Myxococcota bacterium]
MQRRMSVASLCLLCGSVLVGGMGLLWFVILLFGVVLGVAGLGGAALATTVMEVEIPREVLMSGGGLYVLALAAMSVVASVNLVGGGFGLFAALRGLAGRVWGLRTAAMIQIGMALVFGLPGLITMNPLALIWAVVLILSVVALIVVPPDPGPHTSPVTMPGL